MGWRAGRSIDTGQGLGQEILATHPGSTLYYVGDSSHQSSGSYPNDGASDHNPCWSTASDGCGGNIVCAVDIMIYNGPNLDELAEHLRQRVLAGDQRISYLIWDRRIFSGQGQSYPPGVWRGYGGANGHTDHIHASIRHGPDRYDDAGPWGWSTPAPTTVEVPEMGLIMRGKKSGATFYVAAGVIVVDGSGTLAEIQRAIREPGYIAVVSGDTEDRVYHLAAVD